MYVNCISLVEFVVFLFIASNRTVLPKNSHDGIKNTSKVYVFFVLLCMAYWCVHISFNTFLDMSTALILLLSLSLCAGRRLLPSSVSPLAKNISSTYPEVASSGRQLAEAKDHKVFNLPGLSEKDAASIVQYAGHLVLKDPKAGALFYWLFEAAGEKAAQSEPLLIWLNGGPVIVTLNVTDA